MPDITFTLEIQETWIKKIKVTAPTRGEAIAKAKADFVSQSLNSENQYIAQDPEAYCRDVDIKLEWPDGNPADHIEEEEKVDDDGTSTI